MNLFCGSRPLFKIGIGKLHLIGQISKEATQATKATEFAKIESMGPLILTDGNEEDDELEAVLSPYSSLELSIMLSQLK